MTSRCTNLLSLREVWVNFHKWLLKEIGLQKEIYVANNSSDELLMTLSAFASHYQTLPNTKINISLPQARFFLLLKIKPRRIKKRGREDGGSTYLIRPRLVAWFSLGPAWLGFGPLEVLSGHWVPRPVLISRLFQFIKKILWKMKGTPHFFTCCSFLCACHFASQTCFKPNQMLSKPLQYAFEDLLSIFLCWPVEFPNKE